jgi:hypothetical protein
MTGGRSRLSFFNPTRTKPHEIELMTLQLDLTPDLLDGEFSSIPVSPRGYFNHSVRLID